MKSLKRRTLRARPTISDQFKAFGVMDSIMLRLAEGWIHAQQGNPVFFNHADETWYDIPAAARGWIALWERLAERYHLDLDFGPLHKLFNRLDAGMPITPEEVATCTAIIATCKRHYRRMDIYVIGELVKTQKIANAAEAAGLITLPDHMQAGEQ